MPNIKFLRSSELDDLKSELKRHHRSLDEFEVSATPQRLDDESGPMAPNRGAVTITLLRKPEAKRTYATGHASAWVAQFSDDVRNGVF
jgi:hypothetical protein